MVEFKFEVDTMQVSQGRLVQLTVKSTEPGIATVLTLGVDEVHELVDMLKEWLESR